MLPAQAEPIPELPPDLDLASLPQLHRGDNIAEMERHYNIPKPSPVLHHSPGQFCAPRTVLALNPILSRERMSSTLLVQNSMSIQ